METYPKRGKMQSRPGKRAEDSDMQERYGNPYWKKPEMGRSAEEALDSRMNVYGPGTSKVAQKTKYSKEAPTITGNPANPRRTMITS